jgi:hypothetical protein
MKSSDLLAPGKSPRLLSICLSLAVLSASSVLAGCGGGAPDNAEPEVVATINAVYAHPQVGDCHLRETPRYVEQTKQADGMSPMEKCESDARQRAGEAVKVSDVQVTGTKAQAQIEYREGLSAGVKDVISLVEQKGQWKLDQVVREVGFDGAKDIHSLVSQLASSLPGQIAACVGSRLRRLSTVELEDDFLSAAKLQGLVIEDVNTCKQ